MLKSQDIFKAVTDNAIQVAGHSLFEKVQQAHPWFAGEEMPRLSNGDPRVVPRVLLYIALADTALGRDLGLTDANRRYIDGLVNTLNSNLTRSMAKTPATKQLVAVVVGNTGGIF